MITREPLNKEYLDYVLNKTFASDVKTTVDNTPLTPAIPDNTNTQPDQTTNA